MPARVNSVSPDGKREETEENDNIRTVSENINPSERSTTSKQIAPPDDRRVNKGDVNQPTATDTTEILPLPTTNVRSNPQFQPETHDIYSQYQSYGTLPFNVMAVSGNTMLAGQQPVHPCQPILPYQVSYHPPVSPCDGGSFLPKEQPCPVNYEVPSPFPSQMLPTCTDLQLCQYAFQIQPPSTMSPHHLPYQQDPCLRYAQYQHPGLTAMRTTYGYTGFQEVQQESIQPSSSVRSPQHSDSNSSRLTNYSGPECYYNCGCQTKPPRTSFLAPKQPQKNCATKSPATGTESGKNNTQRNSRTSRCSTDHSNSRQGRATKVSSNKDESILSNTATNSLTPPDGVEEGQQFYREGHLSSDSGWISDNSSNKEDGELGDDATSLSPPINEISNRLHDSLNLENRASSSLDESYQESPFSPVSSQCPSTSDDSEHLHVPTKKQAQQPRIMKAIPSRFLNLLQMAAQKAATQKKKLEGYPLFRQSTIQRNHEDQQDQVFVPEMEFAGIVKPQQGTSWYFPGRYLKSQQYQGPGSYTQSPGNCIQGLKNQCSGGYTQGQYQQIPATYFPNQYQGSGTYAQSQYQQGAYFQGTTPYVSNGPQCYQEYCTPPQSVPVYVFQMEGSNLVNHCAVYDDGRSYPAYSSYGSQVAYEKQSSTCYSNPGSLTQAAV